MTGRRDAGAVFGEGGREGGPKLGGRLHAQAATAEGLGELDEVRIAERHAGIAPVAAELLPADDAVGIVPEQDDHDRELQANRRLQLLQVHEKPAVTSHRDHLPFGMQQLGGDRPGSAIPIAAKPLEMITVFGSPAGNIRAIQSLWAPRRRRRCREA